MAKGLFESPKKAMFFVGMTMFSVAMLVGSEDDEGALIQAASSLEQNQGEFDREVGSLAPPRQREPARYDDQSAAFTPDEELIDSAEGFDPTPEPLDPYEPETDLGAGEAQIVRVEVGDGADTQF